MLVVLHAFCDDRCVDFDASKRVFWFRFSTKLMSLQYPDEDHGNNQYDDRQLRNRKALKTERACFCLMRVR